MDLLLHNKDGRVGEPAGAASIPATEFVDLAWPVQPGDYAVRNPRSAIALLLVGETLAKDSATLCADLIEKKLVSRLDHAAYLGRELVRAENALRQGTRYIQDRAQGEINRR